MLLALVTAFLFLNHPFGLVEDKVELWDLCVKDWHFTFEELLDPDVAQTTYSLMRPQFPCPVSLVERQLSYHVSLLWLHNNIMILSKIHEPTSGQAITKSRNRNGC